ncbi:MAG TPA: F0F1 ATP synthase subunit delta [Gaiellaceae bacterium]|nr:F0F1 ATP synthase subunit delta [Gaiellaceae bacterium]
MAVAQRMYARALFEAAREEGKLERVAEDLAALAAAIARVPQLASFLRNPQVEPEGKAEVLERLCAEADPLVRNFVRLVAEKGRAAELPEINRELEALVDRAQGRLSVKLTTAYELSDAEAEEIVRRIEEASGRTVEAARAVDPGLIGGIVLEIGSFRADGSIRGRLERLRHELATAH